MVPVAKTRMQGLCINEKMAGEQLVIVMQALFPTAVAELAAALDENPNWSLDEKFQFVLRRARIVEQMWKMAGEKTAVSIGPVDVVQDIQRRTEGVGETGGPLGWGPTRQPLGGTPKAPQHPHRHPCA